MEQVENRHNGQSRSVGERFKGIVGSTYILSGLPLLSSYLVLSVVVALLLFTLYMTFVPSLPTEPGYTLGHWANIFHVRMLTEVVPNTLIVGVGATLVASIFALPLAWLLNRTALPLRNTFITLMAVVVIVPGFIKAMGWIMLINDRIGLINKGLEALLGVEKVPLTVVNNPYGIA